MVRAIFFLRKTLSDEVILIIRNTQIKNKGHIRKDAICIQRKN